MVQAESQFLEYISTLHGLFSLKDSGHFTVHVFSLAVARSYNMHLSARRAQKKIFKTPVSHGSESYWYSEQNQCVQNENNRIMISFP